MCGKLRRYVLCSNLWMFFGKPIKNLLTPFIIFFFTVFIQYTLPASHCNNPFKISLKWVFNIWMFLL